MFSRELLIKTSNLVVYLAYTSTYYGNLLLPKPDSHNITSGVHESNRDDVYISPAEFTLHIWSLLVVLLGGFVIYQWFEPANVVTVEGIRFYHVFAGGLFIAHSLLAPYEKLVLLDAFIELATYIVLHLLYNNLSLYPPRNLADRVLIHYTFTICTAWVFYATIVDFWIALPFLNTVFSSVLAIIVLGIIGFSFVDYYKRHDVVYAATITWALIGISVRHKDTLPILVSSSVSSGLILGGILRAFVTNTISWCRHRRDIGERTPLVV